MAHELLDFVHDMVHNPQQITDFYADPLKVIEAANLTKEQTLAILTRDIDKIGAQIAKDLKEDPAMTIKAW